MNLIRSAWLVAFIVAICSINLASCANANSEESPESVEEKGHVPLPPAVNHRERRQVVAVPEPGQSTVRPTRPPPRPTRVTRPTRPTRPARPTRPRPTRVTRPRPTRPSTVTRTRRTTTRVPL